MNTVQTAFHCIFQSEMHIINFRSWRINTARFFLCVYVCNRRYGSGAQKQKAEKEIGKSS